jgi:hypothetical protein
MVNGTVLVGKLRSIDLAIVRFKPADISEVTFQLDKVKTMHVQSKLLRVETMFRETYIGYLRPSPVEGMVKMVTFYDTTDLALSTTIHIGTFGNTFWKSTFAYFGAGYSYTKSSDIGRLNFDGKISYVKEHIEAKINASTIMTQEDDVFIRDRENVISQVSYFYDAVWFNQVGLNYQRNLELGLVKRVQQAVGVGARFLAKPNMQAKCAVGYVLNQETGTDGRESGVLSEIPVAITYNFYRFEKPKISVGISQGVFFGVNQSGRIRQDGELSVAWKIITDFSLSMNLYHNYDSRSPTTKTAALDYGIVFTLGYEFQ